MAITVHERHQSRKAGSDWREYGYIVTGAANEVAALNAAPGDLFVTIPHPLAGGRDDLVLEKKVNIEQVIDGSNEDHHTWYATVRYEEKEKENNNNDDDDELNYSISITTHTANVKVAVEQTHQTASGETDPGDFGNWIGVVKNGAGYDIQGVDCIFPQATLEIERRYTRLQWNQKVRQIIHKVGMVNSGSFEGFGEEEVLFAGARVSRGSQYITANYQFMISPTENVNIAGVGNVSKKGWRYIWVYSRPADNGIGTKAVAAYVARVYLRTSFSGIL